jgi:GNAT superfamily N-acetyltransferase
VVGSYALRPVAEVDDDILASFTCGKDSLDEFLCSSAKEYANAALTQTTVVFLDGDELPAAYFSLSADSLRLAQSENLYLGLNFECQISVFPAVKLTRLAVRKDLHCHKLGSRLMETVVGLTYGNSDVGVRLLIVDAANEERVVKFYAQHGFQNSMVEGREKANQKDVPTTVLMWKDLYLEV